MAVGAQKMGQRVDPATVKFSKGEIYCFLATKRGPPLLWRLIKIKMGKIKPGNCYQMLAGQWKDFLYVLCVPRYNEPYYMRQTLLMFAFVCVCSVISIILKDSRDTHSHFIVSTEEDVPTFLDPAALCEGLRRVNLPFSSDPVTF